jgi:hypothetical protein
MKVDKNVIVIVAAVVIGGLALQTLPAPRAKPERPVLKFLAKVAKLGLWVLMAQSAPAPRVFAAHEHVHQVNDNGERILNHNEGW